MAVIAAVAALAIVPAAPEARTPFLYWSIGRHAIEREQADLSMGYEITDCWRVHRNVLKCGVVYYDVYSDDYLCSTIWMALLWRTYSWSRYRITAGWTWNGCQ